MSDKIKAAIRVRPFLQSQQKNGYMNSHVFIDQKKKQISIKQQSNNNTNTNNKKAFHFDYLFSQNDTQDDVYNGCDINHMLEKAIQGYHSTIFAYGQTGSGKTFTMQGSQSIQDSKKMHLDGLIPKIINNLFHKIQKNKQRTFVISVSFLQIYNQKIFDLLNPSSLNPKNVQGGNIQNIPGLRLRWNKNQQFSVQNLFVYQCKNAEQLTKYFIYGLQNRIISAHKLNMQSSRSHSIMTIRVQSFSNINPTHLLNSKIQLVDLAGSQRIGQTGTQGKLAKQSIDINKSLFTLRQVISILADTSRGNNNISTKNKQKQYVPYRDSKLTSILKQSIGGNSYCLMIACINPHDAFLDQNISTLTYATKASYITNQPVINDDPRTKVINDLRYQIKQLNQELAKANQHIQFISSFNQPNNNMKQQNQHNQVNSGRNINLAHTMGNHHYKPSTETSQKLKSSEDQDLLPQPVFKKRLTQRISMSHTNSFGIGNGNQEVQSSTQGGNQGYDQFSQRLVESINMVRQLLKSNKQLRQQLQTNNRRLDQKDIQIYQLTRQNQFYKEKIQGGFNQKGERGSVSNYPNNENQTNTNTFSQFQRTSEGFFDPSSIPINNINMNNGVIDQGRKSSNLRHRSTGHNHNSSQNSNQGNPIKNGNIYGFNSTNSKNNFNYWNSVQINQFYMNQRGVDSMPTNFNRRQINSAQDKRIVQSRGISGGSTEKPSDRNAITAKVSKRSWMSKGSEPKKFLSFYNDPTSKDQVGFY